MSTIVVLIMLARHVLIPQEVFVMDITVLKVLIAYQANAMIIFVSIVKVTPNLLHVQVSIVLITINVDLKHV